MSKTPSKFSKKSKSTGLTSAASQAPAQTSDQSDIASFLAKAKAARPPAGGRGGLVFAMDATMSREHTWDQALHIQAQMFDSVASKGGLDIQLVYFRGYGECRASRWVNSPAALRDLMTAITCQGGQTQIGKVLSHVRKEAAKRNPTNKDRSRVDACVFVGDAMEEDVDALCHKAGQLAVLGVPCFMFQEGHDPIAERAFREIARLTGGAFVRFGPGSAAKLAELLKAVARFAAGGRHALSSSGSAEDRLLLGQIK